MTIEERAEKGMILKRSRNCSQAVALALADETSVPEETLDQIAVGFGRGIGNTKGTCGALSGAVIIAGLKSRGEGTVQLTRQISEEFERLSGAVICADLKSRQADGKPLCSCEDCVRNAVLAYGKVMLTD